ncbi:AAA family ATPase [uncultured Methanobacterium sp.]|uniref:AAA family ATPase n=1 Tax=uncultured Methanobacterium sp. TaxID=176306 RepID=UPI002AA6BF2B|nr:AAA family ATPase [uncultured Methanobacterium sp.]
MNVIGVTGMPGSGKSVVSRVADSLGMKVVRMGDVIRNEAQKRNEAPGKVAVELRQEYGEFVVAERCVEFIKNFSTGEVGSSKAQKDKSPVFLIEGIRSPWEVQIFKKNFPNFKVIAIHSAPKTRYIRLKKRMRSDDSTEVKEAQKRDQRELKFGIGEVIASADFMVVNESAKGKLKNTVRGILKNELQNSC